MRLRQVFIFGVPQCRLKTVVDLPEKKKPLGLKLPSFGYKAHGGV